MEYYRLNLKLDIDLKDYLADEAWLQRTSITALVNNILIDHMNKKTEHEEKPRLTDDEKVILRNVNKKAKYISRNEDGLLFVHYSKPYKGNSGIWDSSDCFSMQVVNHLFRFIKWENEEPWKISDLLED